MDHGTALAGVTGASVHANLRVICNAFSYEIGHSTFNEHWPTSFPGSKCFHGQRELDLIKFKPTSQCHVNAICKSQRLQLLCIYFLGFVTVTDETDCYLDWYLFLFYNSIVE